MKRDNKVNHIHGISQRFTIDCNKLLPTNLLIERAHTYLYEYGAYMDDKYKFPRHWFRNPIFINVILYVYIILQIILLFIPDDYPIVYIILGDFFRLMGNKYHYKIASIIWVILNITNRQI